MMYKVGQTKRFERDYKKAIKQKADIDLLSEIVEKLANGEQLEPKYRDHKLTDLKEYKDARECHINPDWLLIYRIEHNKMILMLLRCGSHSELF